MPLPLANQTYTYQDYVTWMDDERWELIEGIPRNMTPAPSFWHQVLIGKLYLILNRLLEGTSYIIGFAPTDVILSETNVVQPDLFVVCDRSKATRQVIRGAPDLIIEILSPSTSKKDRLEKRYQYEKYGVKEYVILDPDEMFVEHFWRGVDGKYGHVEIVNARQTLILHSLGDSEIKLGEVFEVEKPENDDDSC